MRINRIMTLMAGMTFFMFAPLALAAVQIAFTSAPASEYRVYEGGTYDVSITMTEITDDTKVRMYVKGPIGEASEAEEMIEEYEYIANGMHTFSWDGQFSGGYVPAGDYELRFDGTALIGSNPNTLAHDFSVTDPVRLVLNEELPSLYYTTSPDDLEFSYHLDAVSNSCVRLNINNGSDTYLSPYEIGGTGDYVISWDGEIMGSEAPEGEYDWLLFVDGICSPVNNDGLEGTITVSNDAEPSPVLSDVTADPDPYDPQNGDVTFDYTLSGSVGNTTIYAEVYATSDPGTAIKEWTLTNQGNGSNSVTWDGKDGGTLVSNGAYVFKVWGKDGMKDVLSVQESFTVADTVTPPTSEKCAGYTDVAASDSDCDAIEYVKSIGAMTGNPDGTFAPDDLLQRDQIAKISLETFNLYDDAEDYCDGTDPFPDVTPTSWAYQYICRGVAIDMITGYEGGADAGYYRPARSVNRVEFLALILRNLSDSMPGENSTSYDDVMSGQWYSGYAKYSYDNSLFTGNNLYPTQFTTRAEVAAVIFKLHNLGKI